MYHLVALAGYQDKSLAFLSVCHKWHVSFPKSKSAPVLKYTMKTYGDVGAELHAFLTSVKDGGE
jgi:hypothetical protein